MIDINTQYGLDEFGKPKKPKLIEPNPGELTSLTPKGNAPGVQSTSLNNINSTITTGTPQVTTTGSGIKEPFDLNGTLAKGAGGALSFATSAYSLLSQNASTDAEADARTVNLAASGAAAGAAFGPIGMGVGAVVGGIAGMLKKAPDRIKRNKEAYKEYQGKLFDEKNTRDALAEDDERKANIENLMDLKKAQMGLINLNY